MAMKPHHTPEQSPPDPAIQARLRQAVALHRAGRLAEAESIYGEILRAQPGQFDCLHLLGVIAIQSRQPDKAVQLLDEAVRVNPDAAAAHNNRGKALKDLDRLDEALASYDRALALQPDYAEAHFNRGLTLLALRRADAALADFDAALSLKPDYPDALFQRGNILLAQGLSQEALASFDRVLALRPDHAPAHINRGNALNTLGRSDEALASFDRALAIKPDYAEVHVNRGNTLQALRRFDEALRSYDMAINLKPAYAEAHNNRGKLLRDLGRPDEALASHDQALACKPDTAEVHINRGNALQDLGRIEEALAGYERALALKPDYAEAYCNRGNALQILKRLDEALVSYDRALAIRPGYAEVHVNRGNTLQDLKRFDEAIASYDRALALKADYAVAHNNRGNALLLLRRLDEALESYARALAIKPDYEFLLGTYLLTKMKLCDWAALAPHIDRLMTDLRAGKKVTPPFPALSLIDTPELHKTAARIYCQSKYPARPPVQAHAPHGGTDRIRVGYYSADFHEHATAYLMAELFEAHDARRFELHGFSFGPDRRDRMRARIGAAFDRFHDVSGLGDMEIAQLSRASGIDIAVDLKGYTQDARPGIFAQGCAPIQVSYLGYPGTTGAEYFDYVIADRIVIPPEHQTDFTEKVVYLPGCYQVNDSRREIASGPVSREKLGLPEDAFVYCCFNNNYKILPETFDAWTRILKAVEHGVLWLLEDNPTAARNLRREAEARGVDGNRLIFAKRLPLDEHLARHRAADLFLDTMPCNAHTTASDALWAGLPVLTRMGRSFASRVAASLLNALSLPELITDSMAEYEAKAVELALSPDTLRSLRARLAYNRTASALFDGTSFARRLEAAFVAMHARHMAGLAPDVIEIDATGRAAPVAG